MPRLWLTLGAVPANIVIDDASADDATVIAAEHPAVDLACRLPVNVGPVAARNLGTYPSEAATVVYLDADMVLPWKQSSPD